MGHISNPIGLRLGLSRAWLVKSSRPKHYQEDIFKQLARIVKLASEVVDSTFRCDLVIVLFM